MKRHRQRGLALLPLLLVLIVAIAGLLATLTRPASGTTSDNLDRRLAAAKEALIARAVNDANRPGSLPCPDFVTDEAGLGNFPGDGKADTLTRNDCPSYLGWLPWATLDLGRLSDERGEALWYAVAREFRDDDNAPPLNSEIAASLQVDRDSDVAAIIFAAGPPLAGQQRPSRQPADHLDGSNGDGDTHFVSGPAGSEFNDRLLVIRRAELLAAVEKRVANAVLRCLAGHAAQAGSFPSPAPLSAASRRGHHGSRFGQLPLTQPTAGPQRELADDAERLAGQLAALPATVSTNLDRTVLQQLAESLAALQAYADQVYVVANTINGSATTLTTGLTGFDSQAVAAEANGRISVTERSTLRSLGEALLLALDGLAAAITDSGLDPFPKETVALADQLHLVGSDYSRNPGAATLAALDAKIDGIGRLLGGARATDPVLAVALDTVRTRLAEADAALLAAASGEPTLVASAVNASGNVETALRALSRDIDSRRQATYVENAGDNITRDSLLALRGSLQDRLTTFSTVVTRTQADMVPYAETLRLAAVDLLPWPEMLQRHSAAIATAARKPAGTGKIADNPEALYQKAGSALDAITSSSGALAKLDAYLATPTRSDKQAAADSALLAARQGTDTARNALVTLNGTLASGTAEAFPTVWRHSACAFLQTAGWWSTQGWADNTFYQIAGTAPDSPPTLSINGRGAHRVVVVNGGKTLAGQARNLRRSRDFLEGRNADPGRDGDALAPAGDFALAGPSAEFNDRLAY